MKPPTMYTLQRELAGILPGSLFELQKIEAGQAYFLVDPPEMCSQFGTVALSIPMVEEQPKWFEPSPMQFLGGGVFVEAAGSGKPEA